MNTETAFSSDRQDRRVYSRQNISGAERWASIVAGSALGYHGLTRRPQTWWLLAALGGLLVQRGVTGYCHAYDAFGVNTAGTGSDTRRALGGVSGIHVEESVTINHPAEDLYQLWRKLENLPRFMEHLESVERITDTLSRWRAKGPGRMRVEWNAEIINDVPNELIAWKSVDGSDVVSAGSVHFDEAGPGRGTRVRVRLQYSPPGGKVGATVAKLMGRDPAAQIREDLRRLKQVAEAGEVPTTYGQPRG
jgi:uncharacterized membrane protein